MRHENTVRELMNQLVIADKHTVGGYLAHKGIFTAGTSAVNNAYKILNTLVDAGQLEKGENYYRLVGCKSTYQEHARELTKALAEITKLNLNAKIFREHAIAEVGLRPDAIILLTKEDKGLCLVLEVMNNETPGYFRQKVNSWENWEGAKDYLSNLFKTKIKEFDIVVSGNLLSDDAIGFDTFLEEFKK